MGRLCILLAATCVLLALAVSAGAWTTTTNISNRSDYACNPRVVRDSSNNIHCVWFGGPSGSWRIYYQKYNGSSWTAPVSLSSTGAAYPGIAIDSSNNLHVVWNQGSNPEEIYYRKCTGGTWGTAVNISNTGGRSIGPRVAVDSSANPYVVWHESGMTGGDYDIVGKKCTSGTWGSLENVSNDNALSRNADIVVDSSNNFHCVWEDTVNKAIWYDKRTTAWGTNAQVDTASSSSFGPAMCISPNGYIHVVWHDNEPGNYEMYYRYHNGSSWSSITNLSNQSSVTDCYGSVSADSNNNVHVAWGDYSSIYYRHQSGGSWRPITTVYTNSSKYPVMSFESTNKIHLLWMDSNTGWNVMWNWQNPDTTAPGNVSGFSTYGTSGQVRLDWTNPSDVDFVGTMVRYKTTGYPTSVTDGTLVCDRTGSPGSSDTYNHTGLTNGTTYYYKAFAYDAEPNYASGTQATGVPVAAPKANLLSNGPMTTFSGGVATGWTSYRVNDAANAITFASDSSNYTSSPSQAVNGIDGAGLPTSGLSAGGVYQVVSGLTPGKVYQLVGMQDIYTSDFGADGHRYLLNFGINPSGGTSPGTLNTDGTIGGCQWMTSGQALWNNTSGGSPALYSGFHRSISAFPATASSVSAWSGVTIDNTGTKDNVAAKFNTDDVYLFEWDFPSNASLQNGNFEGTLIDLQDGGDVIPTGWVPAGGGCGQANAWCCDVYGAMSGSNGVRVLNRRGTVNAGLMQKIACSVGYQQTFTAYTKTSGQDSTVGAIGIDPTGGGDITSPNIVWQTTSATSWTQLSVSAAAQAGAITVFIKTSNTNAASSNYHWSYFDDCAYTQGPPAGNGAISGFVRTNGGVAITGATVQTTSGGYSTTSAADGSYTLANVAPATYSVIASKTGYYSQTNTNVVVVAGQTTTSNFGLIPLPGTISGSVKDNAGAALSGATVATTSGGYTTTSDASGNYTLSSVVPGTYSVTASKTNYNPQTNTGVVVVSSQTTTSNFNLVPVPGSVTGNVKDDAGTNVSGATVATNTGGYTTTSDASGNYTLSSVVPGTYNVTASKTNYNSSTNSNVVVNPNAPTTSNFTITRQPGTISGSVKDSSNVAISGATVATNTGGYSTTSDGSGNYTLSNVAVGTYDVTASKTGYQSQTQTGKTVNSNQTTTANFTLTAPTEKVSNGDMEGGFFSTGWANSCSGETSRLPNPSGTWGWNNDASYPFNTFDSTGVVHAGGHSLGFCFCDTASSPGQMGIASQGVNLGAANATATFSVWALHTDGNCPSIMCWNPGTGQNDPYAAYTAGRYQWVTTDNWGQRNTWVTRSMTVTADSSGYVTIMVGGAAHPGTATGADLYIDDVSVR